MTRFSIFFLLAMAFAPAVQLAQANPADSGKPFAIGWRVKGDVVVTSPSGGQRKLNQGMAVLVGESISAAATGEALLKTDDGGLIAVRPNAQFVVESFEAKGKQDDRQTLRLISGALRVVTGWIGKLNRDAYKIVTPVATIGVRGTDHEPYVLSKDLATESYRSGTYDKVTRGGTVLEANGGSIEINPGKVGFVRDAAPVRTRALMTLLMPVLLEKVPDFYLAGSFDQEVDRYSEVADRESLRALSRLNPDAKIPAAIATAPSADAVPIKAAPAVASAVPQGCIPKEIAAYWLERFDGAIQRKDIKTILAMLAPEITAVARVRNGSEIMTMEFNRDELVNSTIASISSVNNYQHRRLSLDAALATNENESSCRRLTVSSIALEQGVMNRKAYRVESREDYVLERRGDDWLAVRAETTQR